MKKFFATLVAVVMVFAMAVPAFADVAVGSIEQKGVEVSSTVALDENGAEVAGAVIEVKTADAPSAKLTQALGAAKTATSVSDLFADFETEIKKVDSDAKVSDYGVAQIFDVTSSNSGVEKATFSVATSLSASDPFMVLVYDGTSWSKVAATIAAGQITVTAGPVGVYAIVNEVSNIGGTSPKNGDMSTGILVAIAVSAALICCVGGCLIIDKKRA